MFKLQQPNSYWWDNFDHQTEAGLGSDLRKSPWDRMDYHTHTMCHRTKWVVKSCVSVSQMAVDLFPYIYISCKRLRRS